MGDLWVVRVPKTVNFLYFWTRREAREYCKKAKVG